MPIMYVSKHIFIRAYVVLKSHTEKPESKPKVLGELASKQHFNFSGYVR